MQHPLPAWLDTLSPAQLHTLAQGAQPEHMGDTASATPLTHTLPCGAQLQALRWSPLSGHAPRAPTVVLLHGGSGSWSHWLRTIGALRRAGRTVWALDLPGQGASDLPQGVRDADDVARILAHTLPAWLHNVGDGEQGMHVAGFSFGALVAAFWAHEGGTRTGIERLVLVGAPGLGLMHRPAYTLRAWQHLDDPREQIAAHWHNLGALMVHDMNCIDASTLTQHIARVRRDRLPRRRLSATDALARLLPQLPCPVRAIYGEHDALYPTRLDMVQALFEQNASGTMVRIAAAGHWVMHEQPTALNAALLQALQS